MAKSMDTMPRNRWSPCGETGGHDGAKFAADTQGRVIDLTPLQVEDGTSSASAEKLIRRRVDQLFAPGVEVKGARHLSVFADKRHRDTEDWRWKVDGEPVSYSFREVLRGTDDGPVGLVGIPLNLSARSAATWATVPVHLGARIGAQRRVDGQVDLFRWSLSRFPSSSASTDLAVQGDGHCARGGRRWHRRSWDRRASRATPWSAAAT